MSKHGFFEERKVFATDSTGIFHLQHIPVRVGPEVTFQMHFWHWESPKLWGCQVYPPAVLIISLLMSEKQVPAKMYLFSLSSWNADTEMWSTSPQKGPTRTALEVMDQIIMFLVPTEASLKHPSFSVLKSIVILMLLSYKKYWDARVQNIRKFSL